MVTFKIYWGRATIDRNVTKDSRVKQNLPFMPYVSDGQHSSFLSEVFPLSEERCSDAIQFSLVP